MPYRADGYEQTGGWLIDPLLYDLDNTSGYELTGPPLGRVEMTGRLLLAVGVAPVKRIKLYPKWESNPTIEVEHYAGGAWTADGQAGSAPGLVVHGGVYTGQLLTWTFTDPIDAREWRVSLRNVDGFELPSRLGLMELWAEDADGNVLPEGDDGDDGGDGDGDEDATPDPVVVRTLDGLVFWRGYMMATRQGGSTDAITWGALQNVRLSHVYGVRELPGPEGLPGVGAGYAEELLSGTFEAGVIDPEQLMLAMGGSMAVVGADTVLTRLVGQQPVPFDLHLESDVPGLDDLDLRLYGCLMPAWSLNADAPGWTIAGGEFRVYGQSAADGGKLFVMRMPGNLTSSS